MNNRTTRSSEGLAEITFGSYWLAKTIGSIAVAANAIIARCMEPTGVYLENVTRLASDPRSFDPGGPLDLGIGNEDYVLFARQQCAKQSVTPMNNATNS